jgi:hypothetical protein
MLAAVRLGAASDDRGDQAIAAAAPGDRSDVRSRQRTFQVVFALLTVHFASLALIYLVDPGFAVRIFATVNEHLGGVNFSPPDVVAWRYGTVCGMATLSLMTLLLVMDGQRNRPLLAPAAFFKVLNAALWFWYWATTPNLPVFLCAGVFDLTVVALMAWAARHLNAPRDHAALSI